MTIGMVGLVILVLLWAFVFAIVYALRSDLFGQRARRLPAPAAGFPAAAAAAAPTVAAAAPQRSQTQAEPTAHRAAPHAGTKTAKRLVITSGPREGVEIDLPAEQLTIGRSSESSLVIRDDYTSTHHARLMLWDDQWVIQDLDSTNGTFLDGSRVTVPVAVPLGTPVTIGTTSFELRR